MQCTKMLTIAAFTVASTLAMNANASDNNHSQKTQSVKKSDNQVIADTLFPNASPAEKARIQDQMAKYSQLQYGFGTPAANPSPTKDSEVLNNIKAHDSATVQSQMKKMREAASELPNLQKLQNNSIKQ